MRPDQWITDRARAVDASGIRRVFELGRSLKNPIDLSIGQPDFPVPDAIIRAATDAAQANKNGYTLTQGIEPLRRRLAETLRNDIGWTIQGIHPDGHSGLLVTSGTSGALLLAALSILQPGDEIILPDPYFVLYPHLATLTGAGARLCDLYPDFHLTAERVEPLLTSRTKAIVACSPGNPTGAVMSQQECDDLLGLCRDRGILLISDEIYDEFTFADARTGVRADGRAACPSPARVAGAHEHVLVVRGFGKTYGVTGWRMGYCAGPPALIDAMARIQQFTFVNAPSIAQWGCLAALDCDMQPMVAEYAARRDIAIEMLSRVTEVAVPGGSFYVFPKIPERLGLSATAFVDKCIERGVIFIPGGVFSSRDTHVRISLATSRERLIQGLEVICAAMQGA